MLFQYLTVEDKDKIIDYINDYSGGHCNEYKLEYMLRFWEEYKQRFEPIFGNPELRLTKNISCKKSQEYINAEIWDLSDTSPFLRNIWGLVYHTDSLTREQKNAVDSLTSNEYLKNNCYDGKTVRFPMDNGKEYVLQNGCKVVKALQKISKIYNVDGFEEFQTNYSRIFNEKNLTGRLVISIHPLDYMTMSDNDCGWDSCMSWKEEGDYRMGTVEMMNSPYVIVAYLESKKDMVLRHNYYSHETSYWNNKKWRELFIFSKDCIVPIKGYPYNNRELELMVLSWLKEVGKNIGWEYDDTLYTFYGEDASKLWYHPEGLGEDEPEPSIKFDLRFSCNTMYNDLCGDRDHYIYILKNHEERKVIHMNFSGPAECMDCGERIYNTEDDPMLLICPKCNGCVKCADCGRWILEDDAYYVNGRAYCYECYSYNMITSTISGELYPESDSRVIDVKLKGYIFENALYSLYITEDEYEELEALGLIHYRERVNCWKPWDSDTYCFDKSDCIYLEDLHKVLTDYTWVSYDDAVKEIKRKLEVYPLYYKNFVLELDDITTRQEPYDRDVIMDLVDETLEKAQSKEDTI